MSIAPYYAISGEELPDYVLVLKPRFKGSTLNAQIQVRKRRNKELVYQSTINLNIGPIIDDVISYLRSRNEVNRPMARQDLSSVDGTIAGIFDDVGDFAKGAVKQVGQIAKKVSVKKALTMASAMMKDPRFGMVVGVMSVVYPPLGVPLATAMQINNVITAAQAGNPQAMESLVELQNDPNRATAWNAATAIFQAKKAGQDIDGWIASKVQTMVQERGGSMPSLPNVPTFLPGKGAPASPILAILR